MRLISSLFFAAFLAVSTAPVTAQTRAQAEQNFRTWLEQSVWPEARRKGVARAVFEDALGGVRIDWDLPGIAPSRSKGADQHQAEFRAPSGYFGPKTLEQGTELGRAAAKRHAAALKRITRETGVPGHVVLGVLGRESLFGTAPIPHDLFTVLATRGYLDARRDYYQQELIAALQILDAGHARRSAMKSSWAGAMGLPQFMPTSFLAHASDGDGDRRVDIWGSTPDALASIARYLQRHGWVAGRDWGFEVTVPAGVSCTLEGPDQARSIRDWTKLGIERVSGKPFPAHELNGSGALMMPAGRHGPAFIVTPNFYVLKEYNFSDLYALYVGHLADRIAFGMGDFHRRWDRTAPMTRSDVTAIQKALIAQGHDVGGADGLAGFKTRRSIGLWQEKTGRRATCFPEPRMAQRIR